jgi:hypothetical protein
MLAEDRVTMTPLLLLLTMMIAMMTMMTTYAMRAAELIWAEAAVASVGGRGGGS